MFLLDVLSTSGGIHMDGMSCQDERVAYFRWPVPVPVSVHMRNMFQTNYPDAPVRSPFPIQLTLSKQQRILYFLGFFFGSWRAQIDVDFNVSFAVFAFYARMCRFNSAKQNHKRKTQSTADSGHE